MIGTNVVEGVTELWIPQVNLKFKNKVKKLFATEEFINYMVIWTMKIARKIILGLTNQMIN